MRGISARHFARLARWAAGVQHRNRDGQARRRTRTNGQGTYSPPAGDTEPWPCAPSSRSTCLPPVGGLEMTSHVQGELTRTWPCCDRCFGPPPRLVDLSLPKPATTDRILRHEPRGAVLTSVIIVLALVLALASIQPPLTILKHESPAVQIQPRSSCGPVGASIQEPRRSHSTGAQRIACARAKPE